METSEYLRTMRGEVGVVAGRKGSGKTAIFFMVRDSFRRQRNTVVIDLRPESHQLSYFKTQLTKIVDQGAFDHTIASFWYFVILSEILLVIKIEVDHHRSRRSNLFLHGEEIDAELGKRLEIVRSGDFTSRVNRIGGYVLNEIPKT